MSETGRAATQEGILSPGALQPQLITWFSIFNLTPNSARHSRQDIWSGGFPGNQQRNSNHCVITLSFLPVPRFFFSFLLPFPVRATRLYDLFSAESPQRTEVFASLCAETSGDAHSGAGSDGGNSFYFVLAASTLRGERCLKGPHN